MRSTAFALQHSVFPFLSTKPFATSAAGRARIGEALADHVALEFCEDRERVEAEARDRVVGAVDAAIDDADGDVVLAEDAVDLRPIGGAPREAIEPVNEDPVDEPFGDGRDEERPGFTKCRCLTRR